MNKKHGFTLVEAMISMLIITVAALGSMTVLVNQKPQIKTETIHGQYSCYYENGQLRQRHSDERNSGNAENVSSCVFTPNKKVSKYLIIATGAGGTTSNGQTVTKYYHAIDSLRITLGRFNNPTVDTVVSSGQTEIIRARGGVDINENQSGVIPDNIKGDSCKLLSAGQTCPNDSTRHQRTCTMVNKDGDYYLRIQGCSKGAGDTTDLIRVEEFTYKYARPSETIYQYSQPKSEYYQYKNVKVNFDLLDSSFKTLDQNKIDNWDIHCGNKKFYGGDYWLCEDKGELEYTCKDNNGFSKKIYIPTTQKDQYIGHKEVMKEYPTCINGSTESIYKGGDCTSGTESYWLCDGSTKCNTEPTTESGYFCGNNFHKGTSNLTLKKRIWSLCKTKSNEKVCYYTHKNWSNPSVSGCDQKRTGCSYDNVKKCKNGTNSCCGYPWTNGCNIKLQEEKYFDGNTECQKSTKYKCDNNYYNNCVAVDGTKHKCGSSTCDNIGKKKVDEGYPVVIDPKTNTEYKAEKCVNTSSTCITDGKQYYARSQCVFDENSTRSQMGGINASNVQEETSRMTTILEMIQKRKNSEIIDNMRRSGSGNLQNDGGVVIVW